jgi:hypothetical protein
LAHQPYIPLQLPAAFIHGLSREDRVRLRKYLYLRLRFQSLRIHPGLDAATCRKAGKSRGQLYKMLASLMRNPEGSKLGRMVIDSSGIAPEVLAKKTGPYAAVAREVGGYFLMEGQHLRRIVGNVLDYKVPRARCTMLLPKNASMAEIDAWMNLKIFEHKHAQTRKPKPKSVGALKSNGDDASASGVFSIGSYPVHEQLKLIESTAKSTANMPMKATAAWMGISVNKLFSLRRKWEGSMGAVKATRRRIHLKESPVDPAEFHRTWGMKPFCVGGLWYAQASNSYELLVDYRGPNAELRKRIKGRNLFGLTISEMLLKHPSVLQSLK